MGHVMRSRAVALELRRVGARPLLVVDDRTSCEMLAGDGLEAVIEAQHPDWWRAASGKVWIDGFEDRSPLLERLEQRDVRALLVENRTPARERAQALVYPALHFEPDDWDRAHADRVRSGAGWIPLGPEVLSQRPPEHRDVAWFVSFGGSDPRRLTERALEALPADAGPVVVTVGRHMEVRREAIEAQTRRFPRSRVLTPGESPYPWMARSQRALTALGTTLYELAFLGVPAGILANYDSDREALAWYERDGFHRSLGVAREGLPIDLGSLVERQRPAPLRPPVELGLGAGRLARSLLGDDL